MHFIQNSWFTHNWILMVLFLLGSLAVVAYINDRKKLLRYSSASFMMLFVFVICFMLLPNISHSLSVQHDLLSSLKVGKSSEERISSFSKIIDFIVRILKDKQGD